MIIWGVGLFVHYRIDPSSPFGEEWTSSSKLQLVGFVILITGQAIYGEIIRIPFLRHSQTNFCQKRFGRVEVTFGWGWRGFKKVLELTKETHLQTLSLSKFVENQSNVRWLVKSHPHRNSSDSLSLGWWNEGWNRWMRFSFESDQHGCSTPCYQPWQTASNSKDNISESEMTCETAPLSLPAIIHFRHKVVNATGTVPTASKMWRCIYLPQHPCTLRARFYEHVMVSAVPVLRELLGGGNAIKNNGWCYSCPAMLEICQARSPLIRVAWYVNQPPLAVKIQLHGRWLKKKGGSSLMMAGEIGSWDELSKTAKYRGFDLWSTGHDFVFWASKIKPLRDVSSGKSFLFTPEQNLKFEKKREQWLKFDKLGWWYIFCWGSSAFQCKGHHLRNFIQPH